MRDRNRLGCAIALLAIAACGDDSGGEPTSEDEAPATPGCRSGQFPGGAGTLTLCGPGAPDRACMPIEKFQGYTKYAGDIAVYPEALPDLTALKCLSEVGRLSVGQSTALTNLHGLENVSKASALELLGNKKLTSLEGIEKLTSVVQTTINSNDSLTDIVGLPEGFSTGSLYVGINYGLTSLDGLKGIKVMRKLAFEGNKKLSKCVVKDFAAAYPGVDLVNDRNLEEVCP